MIKILKGDDATRVVEIDLPEAAYADGVLIEFTLGDLRLLMPSAPRVTLKFPASWTAIQPCGRQLGSFTLISPAGERAAITKTYPVYITNDTSAVGTAGSISGDVVPAIDFSDIAALDAASTPGDTKDLINEILRRLKAFYMTLAVMFTTYLSTFAADVMTSPLDNIHGDAPVVTNVTFEGLATTEDVAANYVPLTVYDNGKTKIFFTTNQYGLTMLERTPDGESSGFAEISPEGFATSGVRLTQDSLYFLSSFSFNGKWFYSRDPYSGRNFAIGLPIPDTDQDFLALESDLNKLKATIPEVVTNVVRDTQGLVYDEKLNITWKQTMYDGNLYYIAVTNANITEVK